MRSWSIAASAGASGCGNCGVIWAPSNVGVGATVMVVEPGATVDEDRQASGVGLDRRRAGERFGEHGGEIERADDRTAVAAGSARSAAGGPRRRRGTASPPPSRPVGLGLGIGLRLRLGSGSGSGSGNGNGRSGSSGSTGRSRGRANGSTGCGRPGITGGRGGRGGRSIGGSGRGGSTTTTGGPTTTTTGGGPVGGANGVSANAGRGGAAATAAAVAPLHVRSKRCGFNPRATRSMVIIRSILGPTIPPSIRMPSRPSTAAGCRLVSTRGGDGRRRCSGDGGRRRRGGEARLERGGGLGETSASDRPARASHAAHRRAERRRRNVRRLDHGDQAGVGLVGGVGEEELGPRRGQRLQPGVGRHAGEVPLVQAGTHRHAELGVAQDGVDVAYLSRLVPRRGHQRLLLLLDEAGAELRRGSGGALQVELLVPPIASLRVERAEPGRSGAVARRGEQRLVLGHRVGGVEDLGELGAERVVQGLGRPRGRWLLGRLGRVGAIGQLGRRRGDRAQRAAEGQQGRHRQRHTDAARRDVDRSRPDADRQRAGAQQQRERLEVAVGPGGEVPRVVHRQLDRREGGTERPGRAQRRLLVGGDLQSETGEAAELERRHHAGEVVGGRGEHPSADEARQRCLGTVVEQPGHLGDGGVGLPGRAACRELAGELGVRPRPARWPGRAARCWGRRERRC